MPERGQFVLARNLMLLWEAGNIPIVEHLPSRSCVTQPPRGKRSGDLSIYPLSDPASIRNKMSVYLPMHPHAVL